MTATTEQLRGWGRAKLADGGAALPGWWLLAALCVASAVTLVVLGTRLTFFNDDWYFLLQRPGLTADSLFQPHNQHIVVAPVLIYKALIELFGLDSQLPFRLVLASLVVALAALVFLFVRERAGQFLALLAAAALLFFGPAAEDLLWSFQIGFVGSLTCGVGSLLILEEDSARRNLAACLLVVASVLFSGLGLSFIVASVIAVLLRRRPAQLWIPAVPAAIFASWWLAYGNEVESGLSAANVAHTPFYALDSIASGLGALAGLSTAVDGGPGSLAWGRPLLALGLVGIAVWAALGGRPSRYLLVVLGAALAFWVLAGFNFIPGREPISQRYQLIHATFLILIAAELFRPVRLRPVALAVIGAAALVAVAANAYALRTGYSFFRSELRITKADLGALEIARGRVPAAFQLLETVAQNPYLSGVTAGAYFRETDLHGSPPVDSPAQIAAASPDARHGADNVLAAGYQLHLVESSRRTARAGCRRLGPRFDGGLREAELSPGGALIANLGPEPAEIGVRRFAPAGTPVRLTTLGSGFAGALRIPVDSVHRSWHLSADGTSPIEVCGL